MEDEKGQKPFTVVDKRKRGEEEEAASGPSSPSSAPRPAGDAAREAAFASGKESSAPPMDFSTFVISLSSSAAYHMGGFQDPVSGKTSINLDLARQTIEIISMLKDKTRGNLTEDESRLLDHALYDLRMRFVELLKSEKGA